MNVTKRFYEKSFNIPNGFPINYIMITSFSDKVWFHLSKYENLVIRKSSSVESLFNSLKVGVLLAVYRRKIIDPI